MSVDWTTIFKQKTGLYDLATPPLSDDEITDLLNQATFRTTRIYATPLSLFTSVSSDKYKYPIVLKAAIEYWWYRAATVATKASYKGVGGGVGSDADYLFQNAMRMISELQNELNSLPDSLEEGSDITVGDLVKRSKQSGVLVPNADDSHGDWTS